MHQQGVIHAEIFFDPQGHTSRGVTFETALGGISSALETAERELGITSKLIMCFLRHLPEEEAFDALDCACKHKELIHGVGLDSSEKGFPPGLFSKVFAAARKQGFIPVAHAGEEGPVDAGLLVTVNSDDPSYFGGYVSDNYKAIQKALHLQPQDIELLAKNFFSASFNDDKSKQAAHDAVDKVVSQFQ